MSQIIKHSATPWQVMNEYDGATVVIANVDGETFADGSTIYSCDFVCDTFPDDGDGSRSREIAAANAEFIVRACNAHDALMEALHDLERYLRETPHHNAPQAAKARAVLAKAGAS